MSTVLNGVFGKYEMEVTAIKIVNLCEKAGTWNLAFSCPPPYHPTRREYDYGCHIGFLHLVYYQFLRPICGLSMCMAITRAFIQKVHSKTGTKLPTEVSEYHAMYSVTGSDLRDAGIEWWKR